jgi:hypothetical protein
MLVHDAEQAKNDRDRVMKKAERTEAIMTLALTVEKERVTALAETLESTLAENSEILRARKKGLQTHTKTRGRILFVLGVKDLQL